VTAPGAGLAGRGGTRRRGEALRTAIFQATLEQLRTVGYAKLTMEGVAAAAGTGKAALYRRWSDRDELVTAALRDALPDPTAIELTGRPRADMLALLACMRDTALIAEAAAFQVVKKEGGPESGVSSLIQDHVLAPARAMILEVLGRGVAAGQLREGVATDRVANVGPAMLIHQILTEGPEVSDATIASIVDEVILPLISR
jgi:AcrR family transcriptional regulator